MSFSYVSQIEQQTAVILELGISTIHSIFLSQLCVSLIETGLIRTALLLFLAALKQLSLRDRSAIC